MLSKANQSFPSPWVHFLKGSTTSRATLEPIVHILILSNTLHSFILKPGASPKDHMSNRHDSLLDGGYWEEEKKSTYLRDATRWSIEILRPAIFTRGPRKQSRRTAYLDGLRGFAAFLVYWQHHQLWPRYKYKIMGADYILENGFGSCCHFFWS